MNPERAEWLAAEEARVANAKAETGTLLAAAEITSRQTIAWRKWFGTYEPHTATVANLKED